MINDTDPEQTIELLRVWFSQNWHFNVDVASWLLLAGVVIFLLVVAIKKWGWRGLIHNEVEMDITLGGFGNVKIKPNYQLVQIAHQAWTELTTRKAGLPIDIDHDVIVEVYDSWHQLFLHIRELIMQIPAQQLKDPETQKLVKILIDSLNKGLRPHLTHWQAKFRRWYDKNADKPENFDRTPQEIQRMYPEFGQLTADLLRINTQIVDYANELKKLLSK